MGNELIVDGVALPTPSTMTCSDYDITEAERNAHGVMIMQTIRENVHKLEMSWKLLRVDQYMTIREAIKRKYHLATQYYIPEQNAKGTISCYVGDRTTPIYMFENGIPVYKDFSCSLIEM